MSGRVKDLHRAISGPGWDLRYSPLFITGDPMNIKSWSVPVPDGADTVIVNAHAWLSDDKTLQIKMYQRPEHPDLGRGGMLDDIQLSGGPDYISGQEVYRIAGRLLEFDIVPMMAMIQESKSQLVLMFLKTSTL